MKFLKQFLTLALIVFITLPAISQVVKVRAGYASGGKIFLSHTVALKESLFAIGRMYNVHPRFLASYNKLDFALGLTVGQQLQIPLTDTNFSQSSKSAVAVYHEVAPGENLYKICQDANKISVNVVKKTNGLNDDALAAGQQIILGYLKNKGVAVAITPQPEVVVEKIETKTEKPKQAPATAGIKVPEVTEPEPAGAAKEMEEAKKPPVAIVEPILTDEGYFKSFYNQGSPVEDEGLSEIVTSGTFQLTKGGNSYKYYVLAEGVGAAVGSIVKITNPQNNKIIYAKVLGSLLSESREKGLNLLIDLQAAKALQVSDTDKFIVKLATEI